MRHSEFMMNICLVVIAAGLLAFPSIDASGVNAQGSVPQTQREPEDVPTLTTEDITGPATWQSLRTSKALLSARDWEDRREAGELTRWLYYKLRQWLSEEEALSVLVTWLRDDPSIKQAGIEDDRAHLRIVVRSGQVHRIELSSLTAHDPF
jgi:hypothetical protein